DLGVSGVLAVPFPPPNWGAVSAPSVVVVEEDGLALREEVVDRLAGGLRKIDQLHAHPQVIDGPVITHPAHHGSALDRVGQVWDAELEPDPAADRPDLVRADKEAARGDI